MAKNTSKANWLSWLIIGVLGVLLIVGRQLIKNALYIVMAVGLIAAAAVNIIGWWKTKEKSLDAIVHLLGNLAMIGIGIWIFANPTAFDTLINVLIGLVLMISGVIWIVRGIRMDKDMVTIVLAAIAIIFGLVIACTNAATGWPIVVEGLGLVYAAIAGIVGEKRLR